MGLTFSDAVDVLEADLSFSVAGTFTATDPPAAPIACRAIIDRRDPEIRVGRTGALAPAWRVMLKRSEITTRPKAGDQIAITEGPWSGTYVVHTVREDSFAPIWDLDVGALAQMGPWDALHTYAKGDQASSSGVGWESLQDANLGHAPETSITWWRLLGPREQVLAAFAAVIADWWTGTGMPAATFQRNQPEPANLVAAKRVLVQVDGEEPEPPKEHVIGVFIHRTAVELECYVSTPDTDPGPAVNDLVERARATILRERDLDKDTGRPFASRVLGSLLYGTVSESYQHPHFSGLEEGRTLIEVYRQPGTEHGAVGILEFFLHYAVTPDAPWILLRPGDGDD